MHFTFTKHLFEFKKPAKTSRGSYNSKYTWILTLHTEQGDFEGEISPLFDLSIDGDCDFDSELQDITGNDYNSNSLIELLDKWQNLPSLRFGLSSIIYKMKNQVSNPFIEKKQGILINGLVWMNDVDAMFEEAISKIESGFNCIKFKVGALDFDSECRLLEKIRFLYSPSIIQIRLDANGAFDVDDSLIKMKELAKFDIHSIEQPIAANQFDAMEELCGKSKIKIALDEELIRLPPSEISRTLLKIKPAYLILKPTLLGGFDRCDEIIQFAENNSIGWWCTSALESNKGLFDIANWVSKYDRSYRFHQGLGTGLLYKENFKEKTFIEKGVLYAN